MKQRALGDLRVGAIGLGGMPMSIEGRPEEARSVATIHAALDAGVTLIDTADAYHLTPTTSATTRTSSRGPCARGRATLPPCSSRPRAATCDPATGRGRSTVTRHTCERAARESARRLGVDAIGLYQFHRPDPTVPYAESVGALAELLDEGVIQRAGISNATVAQIDEANEVLGGRLVSVQNQFSPTFRSSHDELRPLRGPRHRLPALEPLGGISSAGELGSRHAAFADVARAHGVSPQQVALAWELSLADVVIPIPGASRPASIEDSVRAADLELDDDELAALSSPG